MNRFFLIVCTLCIFSANTNAANFYWVGGTGDWNDLSHWATSSGGNTFHGHIPTALDDVFFDANSFPGPSPTVTVNVTGALCNNMDWTGVTNNPEFFGPVLNTLKIYGSLTLAPVMKLNLFGPISFEATTTGKTITSVGQIFNYSSIAFNGIGGGWTLTDSLTLTAFGDIQLNNGVLNTNGKKVTASSFSSGTMTSRSLIMSSSTFNLLNAFSVSSAAMTMNASASTINLTSPGGCSFSGGGFVYNNLNLAGPGPVNDDNTFHDVFFASDGAIAGNNSFHDVVFSGNGSISGNNSFTDLQFTPGYTYILEKGKTQTINATFSAIGNCGGHITILTSLAGNQSTISHPPGAVAISFAILKDINATGGATFSADNSIDLGNNSGWTINVQTTQDLFWVGNSGNWNDLNHWSNTSGGSPSGCCPTPADNVFFDANSFSLPGQTVTINGAAFCKNITWTGALNNPSFASTSSDYLKIYGSLVFIPGMTLGILGNVYFEATTTGKTITSSGKAFSSVIFNGIGGGWTLQDGLKAINGGAPTIYLNNGVLNTNNQTVTADAFKSNSSTARTLTMGSSVFNLSGGGCWQVTSSGGPGLTLNSGTSIINATNPGGSSFTGDGLVYYNLNFTGPGNIGGNNTFNNVFFTDNGIVYGDNIFNNATFLKNGEIHGNDIYNNLIFTAGFTYMIVNGTTQTINTSLTANGTCASRITIASDLPGVQSIISHPPGAVTVSYVSLKDLRAIGGAIFTANNAIDLGNNNGWIINSVSPRDFYWINNSGNWDDGNHWSLTSGGPPLGCLPSPVDNVFFDVNSFTAPGQTVNINVPLAYCKNMTWSGAINNPVLDGVPINLLKIYGSLTLISGMTQNFMGSISFEATTAGKTITSAGKSFLNTVTLNGVGGGWSLQDSLTTTSLIYYNNGILNTNNHSVNAGAFLSYSTTARTLNMGSSIFNLSNVGLFWDINPNGITINAGTSVINNTNSGNASQTSFRASGFTFHNLNFNNTSGIPGTIIGNNTFNDVFFVTEGSIENNNIFHNVVFSGNGAIRGNNVYSNLTFTPNYVYTLTSGKTQTIQNRWSIQGSCDWYILLQSSIAGSPTFITKASGTVNAFNMHIRDIHCSGGATFNAYNCVDLGGNSGWNFLTLGSLSNPGPITGPVSVCSGQTGVIYYINSVTGAISYNWTVPPGAVITSGQGDTSIVVDFGTTSGNVSVTAFNGCEFSNVTSNLAVTVNPILTPAITITASPGATICTGTSATFTATASNTGGGTVNYNFKINGVSVQNGASNIYTSASLVTGDAVNCVITITGGGSCLTTNTATSNTITITVMAYMTPAVNITVSPQSSICAGIPVTFTANATNTGSGSVNYNFKINGTSVQNSASNTYTSTAIVNGDAVSCDITVSGGNCLTVNTASSNTINMTVSASYTPAVNIVASPAGPVCGGTSVTFTATASNTSGGTVDYNFKINGTSVQNSASNNYTSASLVNGDAVTCDITITGGTCLTLNTASSNTIVMTVMASTPSVSIAVSPQGLVCAGTSVTFTATASNTSGGTVMYNFKINGVNVQSGVSNTYTSTALINGDAVSCDIIVSGGTCLIVNTATSNTITMMVMAYITPAVSMTPSPLGSICAGTPVTFTATASNTSSGTVNYNFKINGASVQNGASNTYTSSSLVNGDAVTCDITITGGTCLTANQASSNTVLMTVMSFTPTLGIVASPQGSICAGTSVIFTATASNTSSGSVNYNFKINGTPVQNGPSNTYTSSAFVNGDAVTCDIGITGGTCLTAHTASSNTILMTLVTYTPSLSIVASPQGSICAGTTVTFAATASNTSNGIVNYNFKINGTSVQSGPSNIYSSSTLRNGNTITCDINISGGNCLTSVQALSNTITMQVIRPAHLNLGDDPKICTGDYIILKAPDIFTNYLWNTGDTSKFITVTQPSIYWLRVRDQNGCMSSDTISVSENHICGTFIPSGFTPNNDGLNDVFKPVITGNMISYKFSIYNRWGQKIFESDDLQKGWDGTLKNQPLKTDVFIWLCEYQLAGKPVIQKRGTVTMIR